MASKILSTKIKNKCWFYSILPIKKNSKPKRFTAFFYWYIERGDKENGKIYSNGSLKL